MANRIDAAMQATEAARPDTVPNGSVTESQGPKLAEGDHAVLARRELPDPHINPRVGTFGGYVAVTVHAPSVEGRDSRMAQDEWTIAANMSP